MFDKSFFKKILEDHEEFSDAREHVIAETRNITRDAKQAIFRLHEQKVQDTKDLLDHAERALKKLNKYLVKHPRFHHDGNVSAAREEFLEAKYFFEYKNSKTIKRIPEIQASFLDEWGALADFTGELVRDATRAASERDVKSVQKHRDVTSQIVGEMLKLHLSGKLRQKTDEAKRNLNRLEQLLYELSR